MGETYAHYTCMAFDRQVEDLICLESTTMQWVRIGRV